MTLNARAQAAQLLAQVMQGKSLSQLLQTLDHPKKPFVQALCFGVLRQYFSLGFLLKKLLHKPVKDADIHALLLLGLYQLLDDETKDHAAINETVNAATALQKTSSKSLVNAILRNFQRKKSVLLPALENDNARFECPPWLLKTLQQDWPTHWQAICAAQQLAPPMTLRVNLAKNSRQHYLKALEEQGIKAKPLSCNSAIELQEACAVDTLPGFAQAEASVQDQAGQLVPSLLNIQAEMHILDACSAPGSKLTHLFEVCPSANFTAVELDKQRVQRLQNSLDRHQIQAGVHIEDAANPDTWWDKQPFDLILLDAPCSASGVIRRHPDIKLLRREQDIAALATTQLQLLQALAPLLKTGGQLLYTTCSVLNAENEAVIKSFLNSQDKLKAQNIRLPIGQKTTYGWQILPGDGNCDGFYFSLLA
jgi:16S rRNA (cytosine967-C5)-methyltransferase